MVDGGLLDPAPAAAGRGRRWSRAGSLVALGDGWLMTPADYRAAAATARAGAGRPRRRGAALPRPAAAAVAGTGRHADALLERLERDGVLERRGAEAVAPGTRATSETAARAADVLLDGAVGRSRG